MVVISGTKHVFNCLRKKIQMHFYFSKAPIDYQNWQLNGIFIIYVRRKAPFLIIDRNFMWCRGVEVDVKRLPKRPAPPRFGRKLTEAQKARLTVQWCNFRLALFLCIICLKWDLCNVHANMNEVDQFFRPKQRTYALIVATYTPCRNLSRSRQVYLWTLVKPFDWYQGLGITLVLYSSVVFEPDSPFLTFKSVALWTILLISEETKHLLFPW